MLVKVSGAPALGRDPRVGAMAAKVEAFVRAIGYRDLLAGIPVRDEQGTRERPYELTVWFDRSAIDGILRELGSAPWPAAARPRLAVLLTVDAGGGSYRLTRDGVRGRDQRESLAAASEAAGLATLLPPTGGADDPDPWAAARAFGADLPLVGTLAWEPAELGWRAAWRLIERGRRTTFGIAGVSFDDAFRHAIGGSAQILSGHGPPAGVSDRR